MTALPSGDSRLRAGPGTYAGLFVITLATLMFEIALTRIFSATMWYHFAFVAISVALFGLTVGALVVHSYPHRFDEAAVRDRLWQYALLFGITLVACFTAQLSIPFVPEPTAGGALSVFLTCVVVSIPFVCSGVVVSLALTRFPREVNRLYATDLVGAALGCLVLVALFVVLDGPSLIVGIGSLAGIGALLFAASARSRYGVALALVVVVGLGGFCALNAVAHGRGEPILRILWAKEEPDPVHEFETWNAFSRITVDPVANGPARPRAVGMSPTLPSDLRVEELEMLIDSSAATVLTRYTGRPEETDHLRYNVINLAHWIRKDADVLVIGAGGGRDVLSALEFGQRSVTAVEINGRILEAVNGTYGDFTGHLDRDPRVRFVNDEARSYLARTDRKYDVIQIALVDTWAATAAGAFALSESSLYTTQAWDIFLDRLAPGGVISVARWFTIPGRETPLETYRALALAAQALTDRGVARPREHILLYRGPDRGGVSHATLLVSPQPLSEADAATLRRETERLEFTPVLTRTVAADERFAALAAPGGPGPAVADFSIDVSAPSDDRPFFFQMARLETLFGGRDDGAGDLLQPVFVLAILAVTVLILTSSFIAVPLLLTTDRLAHRGMLPFYLYFAGIGLGFLLVEISQLQRLSVFLGHPVYALTVVLFSLLVFSGIGSMVSERLADPIRGAWRVVPLLAALAVVGACGLLTPRAIDAMDGATTPARIATAVALLAPLGFVLGMPFAIGMRAASTRPNAPTAFLWGLNGATSVCASVFAVVIAVFFGISAAYWTGFAAYALATAALVTIAVPARDMRADPS